MKRWKWITILTIICLVLGGVVGVYFRSTISKEESSKTMYNLEVNLGDCSENQGVIDEFLEVTQRGQKAILTIKEKLDIDVSRPLLDKSVRFDGDKYLINENDLTDSYSYFYKVLSDSNNDTSVFYILANQKYTYDEIIKSLLSSQLNDHLDFIMVCVANQ